MKELLTPKQVGRAIGVSEASVKRWCDRGLIPTIRTAGGHRRLPINGVIQFLRKQEHPIVCPEVLGLPPFSGQSDAALNRSMNRLKEAFQNGDEPQCRQIVLNLYLAGREMTDICDRVMAPAFHALGDAWRHGDIEVFQERRGCEICLQLLHELKGMLPAPPDDAPYAIGGALEADPYALPNAMTELTLREHGWLAESYGCCNPAETLAAAIQQRTPRLFWLSVSTIADPEVFLREYHLIRQTAAPANVALAVGGRALTPEIRKEMPYCGFCDNLRHLVGFIENLPDVSTQRRNAGRDG